MIYKLFRNLGLIVLVYFSLLSSQTFGSETKKLFDEYYKFTLKNSPMLASRKNEQTEKQNKELDDFSVEHIKKKIIPLQNFLKRANFINSNLLNQSEKISLKLFKYILNEKLAEAKWGEYIYPIDHIGGIYSSFFDFMKNYHDIKSKNDAKSYISRVKSMKRVLIQISIRMNRSTKKGIALPQFSIDIIKNDIQKIIDDTKGIKGLTKSLIDDFELKISKLESLSENKKRKLKNNLLFAIRFSMLKGYIILNETLKKLKSRSDEKVGLAHIPYGKEFYSFLLKKHTSTNLDAEEIHKRGLIRVTQIHNGLRAAASKLGIRGNTIQEIFKKVRKDPRFLFAGKESPTKTEKKIAGKKYVETLNNIIFSVQSNISKLFGLENKFQLVIEETKSRRAFSYSFPSPDGSKPGRYLINLDNPHVSKLEVLAYHEAVPGHHMQIGIQLGLKNLPKFRSQYFSTAYGEGWGLYAEGLLTDPAIGPDLIKEFGAFNDPVQDFGRWDFMLRRAIRLVTDTGLHYLGWSREKTAQYFIENSPEPEESARFQTDRYIVWPGQATSYMIGMEKIKDLRAFAKEKLGPRFSIKDFHDTILGNGSLPLNLLEENVLEWVNAQ